MNAKSLSARVLLLVADNPGIVGITVADHFQIENKTYGRQRMTSNAIRDLRQRGLLRDTARCRHCNRALTRGHRNVPLHLTPVGEQMVKALRK